jgi:hypothetical protein
VCTQAYKTANYFAGELVWKAAIVAAKQSRSAISDVNQDRPNSVKLAEQEF